LDRLALLLPRNATFSASDAMVKFLKRLWKDESGPTAVEYAVMLALIVGVCITSVQVLARNTGDSFNTSAAELSTVLGS
jgi:pilus assembly protein Flp/PilA